MSTTPSALTLDTRNTNNTTIRSDRNELYKVSILTEKSRFGSGVVTTVEDANKSVTTSICIEWHDFRDDKVKIRDGNEA